MNPQETLTDIYQQIAVIRQFACKDAIAQKDKIIQLPSIDTGNLNQGLILNNDTLVSFTYNLALQKIFQESHTWSGSSKRLLSSYANSLYSLLEGWINLELNSFYLITALNQILLKIAEKERELTKDNYIVETFGVQFGNREVPLNGGTLAVIKVIEYPDFVGKEFYYAGTLPSSQGITITQGVFAAIYSDPLSAYTQYRVRILAPSVAIPLTKNDSRLLITAYDNISTKITIYE